MNEHPWTRSTAGLVIGALLLVLVTAVLTAAVYSFIAAGVAKDAVSEVKEFAADSEARSERASGERAEQSEQTRQLLIQNREVLKQNNAVRAEVRRLVAYLREHNIEVPRYLPAPPVPKAKPSKPKAGRKPVGPTKPRPAPSALCQALPVLCQPIEIPEVVLP